MPLRAFSLQPDLIQLNQTSACFPHVVVCAGVTAAGELGVHQKWPLKPFCFHILYATDTISTLHETEDFSSDFIVGVYCRIVSWLGDVITTVEGTFFRNAANKWLSKFTQIHVLYIKL